MCSHDFSFKYFSGHSLLDKSTSTSAMKLKFEQDSVHFIDQNTFLERVTGPSWKNLDQIVSDKSWNLSVSNVSDKSWNLQVVCSIE